MKKVSLNSQTGQDGSNGLSDLDHKVLDIIGRDTVQLKGIGVQDDPPQFGSPREQSTDISRNTVVCIPGKSVCYGNFA